MNNTFIVEQHPRRVNLGSLRYGTFLTHAPNNPTSIYVKVDKRKLGQGICMQFPQHESVLCNIKTGALRSISGNAKVTVLQVDAVFNIVPLEDLQDWNKY